MIQPETCSIEAFKLIATSVADKNNNGKIDDAERSVFENYMSQYDLNNDGKVDDLDVKLYNKSMTFTDEEIAAKEECDQLLKKYGIDNSMSHDEFTKIFDNMPKEAQKKVYELTSKYVNASRSQKILKWKENIINAWSYFLNLTSEARGNLQSDLYNYVINESNKLNRP